MNIRQLPLLCCSLLLAAATSACGDAAPASTTPTFDDEEVITAFADDVVIATYAALAARAAALDTAVDALVATPDDAHLTAARAAWAGARELWEQSEGFLFGPVDSLGIDPALDSWPLAASDIERVLAGADAFTPSYVAALDNSWKGFHALEYLLWGTTGSKAASALTARELAYASAIAVEFQALAERLVAAWTTGDANLTEPYRTVFVTAGAATNRAYPSRSAAAQEIVNGMIGICDEVANGKIADPFDARDPNLEESQFSKHSITDFQNNIRSVQNAYRGAVPAAETSGRGIGAWLKERDPALDAKIESQIAQAIEAIGAIPHPFGEAILDNAKRPAVEAAQAAVSLLQRTLERELLPYVR